MAYPGYVRAEDIKGPVIVRSCETGILFGGFLRYMERKRPGVYVVINECPLKTFGPLHTDDTLFDSKTMGRIDAFPL